MFKSVTHYAKNDILNDLNNRSDLKPSSYNKGWEVWSVTLDSIFTKESSRLNYELGLSGINKQDSFKNWHKNK